MRDRAAGLGLRGQPSFLSFLSLSLCHMLSLSLSYTTHTHTHTHAPLSILRLSGEDPILQMQTLRPRPVQLDTHVACDGARTQGTDILGTLL